MSDTLESKDLIRLTQLFYSCWILSATLPGEGNTIPSDQHVWAEVLRNAKALNIFPEWARDLLHFIEGDSGLVCLEFSAMEDLAATMKITGNYDYISHQTYILVGKPVALRHISWLKVSEDKAKDWGHFLRRTISCIQKRKVA